MTYLVLARKWRPRSFDTLVGQEHVVRALTNALSTQRLHHAWLFTGTRGVGKTTLSRILAKALNCEQGITATPCGECSACTEIDSGRFVDYIELDAASNRGVDEMTQLLEQAVYSPSSGRFKVYMIDEVHMLSGHAFNAMLKTLEEPPAHVKFILATTDPQKIPATVLSRCLQFNLKQMTAEGIISYLETVLGQENISYETNALRLLARAASGSMRDALSLTDQAIAYSADNITSDAVQSMLGAIDQSFLTDLIYGLAQGSAEKIIEVADTLASMGLSYGSALDELAVLLSRIAIEQRIQGSVSSSDPQADEIKNLANGLSPDVVQLFYSVAVHSRSELSLAPDEYAGFVMACFRMLALLPTNSQNTNIKPVGNTQTVTSTEVPQEVPAESTHVAPIQAQHEASIDSKHLTKPSEVITKTKPVTSSAKAEKKRPKPEQELTESVWPKLVNELPLTGATAELARQSEFLKLDGNCLYLRMGVKILGETSARSHLQTVLSEYFGKSLRLDIEYAATGSGTAFAIDQAHLEKLQQQAQKEVESDVFINELINEFQAKVVEGSVKPVI